MSISAWPGRAHLVVLHLDLDAARDQVADHLRAQVGVVVHRRHREVAALEPGLVGQVVAVLFLAGVPRALERIDVVVALVRGGREAGRVEDVELRLGAEERRVADARAAQVVLGLAGDVARVPGVRRAGQRVVHEEREVQGLVRPERVEHRGGRVGQQLHVGLVDLLEPADRRAVEHEAVGEDPLTERRRGHGEVLHRSRQVAEPDVDELHVFLCDEAEDLLGTAEHQPLQVQGTLRFSRHANRTLAAGNFRAVSDVFHECYAPAAEVSAPIMARCWLPGPERIPWCRGQETP